MTMNAEYDANARCKCCGKTGAFVFKTGSAVACNWCLRDDQPVDPEIWWRMAIDRAVFHLQCVLDSEAQRVVEIKCPGWTKQAQEFVDMHFDEDAAQDFEPYVKDLV